MRTINSLNRYDSDQTNYYTQVHILLRENIYLTLRFFFVTARSWIRINGIPSSPQSRSCSQCCITTFIFSASSHSSHHSYSYSYILIRNEKQSIGYDSDQNTAQTVECSRAQTIKVEQMERYASSADYLYRILVTLFVSILALLGLWWLRAFHLWNFFLFTAQCSTMQHCPRIVRGNYLHQTRQPKITRPCYPWQRD